MSLPLMEGVYVFVICRWNFVTTKMVNDNNNKNKIIDQVEEVDLKDLHSP